MPKNAQRDGRNAQIYTTQLDGNQVARKALAGEPILVYPKGTHHREMWGGKIKTWEVDDDIITDLVENYTHRLERGIRQGLLPVNEDHNGSRALGYFDQVAATPEGLAASFTWNPKGREALENGEFAYFSLEIYDEMVDRVTGETVKNQISGGALTNYPFFGEAAALMSRSAQSKEAPMPTEVQHQDAPQDVAWYRGLVDKLTGQFTTGAPAQNGSPIQDRKGEDLRAEFDRRIQEIETQMESRIADVESERDAYARQIDDLRGQLSQTEDARGSPAWPPAFPTSPPKPPTWLSISAGCMGSTATASTRPSSPACSRRPTTPSENNSRPSNSATITAWTPQRTASTPSPLNTRPSTPTQITHRH
ncbi:MAG: hypothetical protein GVY30_00150 [Chloroflexi bacterium]|jgi:hypothetical protein|nr:hypothetical protein [Chloroflexota bacterium]